MKALVVGLGNPGKEYETTYHNVGVLALESLAPEKFKKYKDLFEYAETDATVFVRPLTYMNESGTAVRAALKNFKAKPASLVLIHDDSDIIVGEYKISFDRNSAGHKGVQSVIDALGTKEFSRIRIGIRPARERQRQKVGEFALKKIATKDMVVLKKVFEEIFTAPFPSSQN